MVVSRAVVWFRNDLRIHDNPILQAAVCAVQSGQVQEVVPCYCVDPRHFQRTPYGNPKTNFFRARFLLESVTDLKKRLRAIGSDLLVTVGKPEDVIPLLVPSLVLTGEEPAYEEQRVERALARALEEQSGGVVQPLWGHTLLHVDDIPYSSELRDFPDGFTSFKNKVEQRCTPRPCLPSPAHGSLPLPAVPLDGIDLFPSLELLPLHEAEVAAEFQAASDRELSRQDSTMPIWKGGETEALARLEYYLWDKDLISDYFQTRNGMLGGDYSTKFSPWLALGCLSPRLVYAECKRYEAERVSNKSTYWVVFELLWRDFFRFFCMKHGNNVFFAGGATASHTLWKTDVQLAERWKSGSTGVPLIDANMRELAATGFQSNRGRQNVASYLCHDLGLDWRIGADHFESLLVDHDVSSNYGNWNAAAGLTGGRINKFNIVKQSRDYDPQGEYIRTWVPELREVPLQFLFEPWKMSKSMQEAAGCVIGEHYPAPPTVHTFQGGANRKGKGGRDSSRANNQGKGSRHNRKRSNQTARRSEFEMYG